MFICIVIVDQFAKLEENLKVYVHTRVQFKKNDLYDYISGSMYTHTDFPLHKYSTLNQCCNVNLFGTHR